jgi:hypothetical protein
VTETPAPIRAVRPHSEDHAHDDAFPGLGIPDAGQRQPGEAKENAKGSLVSCSLPVSVSRCGVRWPDRLVTQASAVHVGAGDIRHMERIASRSFRLLPTCSWRHLSLALVRALTVARAKRRGAERSKQWLSVRTGRLHLWLSGSAAAAAVGVRSGHFANQMFGSASRSGIGKRQAVWAVIPPSAGPGC